MEKQQQEILDKLKIVSSVLKYKIEQTQARSQDYFTLSKEDTLFIFSSLEFLIQKEIATYEAISK